MSRDTRPHKNRIYRSNKDVVCSGVCGGIAEHFDFAPWGVRLIFMVLALVTSFIPMLIIYCILCMTMKKAPPHAFENYEEEEFWNMYQASRSDALRKIHRTFERLDKRMQRMESIVTSPEFELEEQYRNL